MILRAPLEFARRQRSPNPRRLAFKARPRLASGGLGPHLDFVLILFFNGTCPNRRLGTTIPRPKPRRYWPRWQSFGVCCTRASMTVPFMKERGSFERIEAIKDAIDDFAECEMGARQFFWAKAHGRRVG